MKKLVLLLIAMVSIMAFAETKEYSVYGTMFYAGGKNGKGTASGDKIIPDKVKSGEHRWVALSKDMYAAGFRFNDTIVVTGAKADWVNGEWVVKDKMAGSKKIDFLVHRSQGKLFKNGQVTIRKKEKK